MAHPEADQQKLFFEFLSMIEPFCFQAGLVFAVPNGSYLAGGARAGAWMKNQGLKKGVPDIICPYPRHDACGLAIEMKSAKGKATPEQENWLSNLQIVGWQTSICHSAVGAFSVWSEYSAVHDHDVEMVKQSVLYQVALQELNERKK
jgi:hypothetical protein